MNIGPTKRSVDVPEYVELEGKYAKLNQDYAQLMSLYNQLKIKAQEANSAGAFLVNLRLEIEEYVRIRDLAEKLRQENNRAAAAHGPYYYSPAKVTDATRDWTVSAIRLANKLSERIGK